MIKRQLTTRTNLFYVIFSCHSTNAYIYAVDPHTNAILEMEQLQE